MSAFSVYLILEFSASLLFSLIFTVNQLYLVTVVELAALQLVLIGTILEATVFLFEIPTGVLADVKSRRLSVVIGYVIMGLGFVVEGSLPLFWSVALAQIIWGFGYTFTSGATEAWIADELGQQRAGEAYLRGAQAARVGALLAIPISVVVGSIAVRLPIVIGGTAMILLAVFLAAAMPEEGFAPVPPQDRTTWGLMLKTVRDARAMVRRQPVLLALLGIALFYGLYSEGFDRLWTPHLLESFDVPLVDVVEPVVWFGVIRGILLLVSLAATEIARRRVDTNRFVPVARVLLLNAALIVVALVGFGLTRNFWIAIALYWLIGALRSAGAPLHTTWFNLRIDDAQVRATMFSISGQVDAVGQIAGGPPVGAIGNRSIRAALVTSALLLLPVIPLYAMAMRLDGRK
jgi:DHA3 family tetracycline resistance protein-like MFS transporter